MALYGYARVSSRDQETHLQIDALRAYGVAVIYQEKTSSVGTRLALQRLLAALRRGDVLVVYKMGRIARSLKDLLGILDRVQKVGAAIRSLTEPLDTSGPIGMFMVQVLGAVVQLERSMIRERAVAGQVALASDYFHRHVDGFLDVHVCSCLTSCQSWLPSDCQSWVLPGDG